MIRNALAPDSVMEKMRQLFAQMDQAYEAAAQAHGFECQGCRDNCCLTRFYHYTLAEYLYLHAGLKTLPTVLMSQIREQAAEAIQKMNDADQRRQPVRFMCPLNQKQRCILYAYRPMICRLHGIPHLLRRPDGRRQIGPGCDDFDRQCGPCDQPILDRTPLYTALAALERELRQAMGFTQKIKMTIAEMISEDLFA